MFKKWTSLLLVLLLMLTGTAVAQEAVSPTITLSVLDPNGDALIGADVTVVDADWNVVEQYRSDGQPHAVKGLEPGFYTARATDPADGYAATANFYADADREISLVIRKLQAGTKATVGSVTRMSGAFFTDMWGNNTADIDVRALLHGQSTVAWTNDSRYGVDRTVVRSVKAQEDADGNKTYLFTLNDGLKYNDGTPITAKDYVFSVLFQSAKETAALGAHGLPYAQLLGYEDYASGKSDVFAGVRLTGLRQFELTIDEAYLPYFYELTYVNVTPYPISVIAPGCEVRDDGKGAYIEGAFSTQLLAQTVLDPQTGYLSHPGVTSGPYSLTGYDAQASVATFTVNPNYPGNYEGVKPVIEQLELREVKYDSALEQLADGTLTVINKATSAALIDEGVKGADAGEWSAADYLRSGHGLLAFACEEDVTQSLAVRQAMAMCLDRDALVQDFLGSYGMGVYSYYGLGQWMAQPYASVMQEHVKVYPYDTEAAEALLEKDGWTLNEQGEAYVPGEDAVRYKKRQDGTLMPLEIRFAQLKDNEAAQWLGREYAQALTSIGFRFEATEVTFDQLLRHYYRQDERTYNLMYLATNFAAVFDPYYTFHTDDAYQGTLNTSGLKDKKLMDLAASLHRTGPKDEQTYTARWLKLMERFSEVLPSLPIYSNSYYDFYANSLMNYRPQAQWSWASAILYAYFAG